MRTDSSVHRSESVFGNNGMERIAGGVLRMLGLTLQRKELLWLPIAFLVGRANLADGMLPFGFAFFAAIPRTLCSRLLVAVSVLVGAAAGGSMEHIYGAAASMLLYRGVLLLFKRMEGRLLFKQGCMVLGCMAVPQMVLVSLQGLLIYDVLRAVFSSFAAFVVFFIFRTALAAFERPVGKSALSSEETISLAITAGLVLAGFGDFRVLGFSPRNILSTLLILLFSFKCGAGVGSAAGVSIGLITSLSSAMTPIAIGSYGFCGLLAGVFRGLGKVGAGLGFVLGNIVLTIYLSGSEEVLVYLREIVAAVGIFLLIPKNVIDLAAGPFNHEVTLPGNRENYTRRIRDLTVEKLDTFARTFKELSRTFGELSETKSVANKHDISILFDRVADRVCKDCSLCMYCWDRNFYTTYQVMFNIVECLEEKGYIEQKDIPEYFVDKCARVEDFVDAVNNIYELFRVDMVWKSRMGESRGLISQQFEGLSKVISGLADEINVEVTFFGEMEDELFLKLDGAGLRPREVSIYKNRSGKFEAELLHKGCGGSRMCVSHIEKLASGVLGRKMACAREECCLRIKEGSCRLKLLEAEPYRITTGVARLTKQGSSVSGDSYTFMNDGRGKYIMALSDGMGSGRKAAIQSRTSVGLLENFMESGFDKDTALKLINSVLVLRSGDDSFSTLDISIIDLFNGEVEFVKTGAAPTYLMREGRIETVRSATLPAGILENIETELARKKMESGDFIIMVTDGVADAFINDGTEENSLVRRLQEIASINPQQIADTLLDAALSSHGGKAEDDMTVLVAKIWKSI